jgi:hypothetical protein
MIFATSRSLVYTYDVFFGIGSFQAYQDDRRRGQRQTIGRVADPALAGYLEAAVPFPPQPSIDAISWPYPAGSQEVDALTAPIESGWDGATSSTLVQYRLFLRLPAPAAEDTDRWIKVITTRSYGPNFSNPTSTEQLRLFTVPSGSVLSNPVDLLPTFTTDSRGRSV